MTLEQVNALVTILDLSHIVKDGMCLSEPIMCQASNEWIDVFFTYGINYDEENYSGPISVFGINSEKKEILFIKTCLEFDFPISADDVVSSSNWNEEGARFYDDYSKSYEKMRSKLLSGKKDDISKEAIQDYIDLLKKYTDESFWCIYSVLLKDVYNYLE